MIMSGSHKVRDSSRGRLDKSGALILEQMVYEERKPTRRSWRIAVPRGQRNFSGRSPTVGPASGRLDRPPEFMICSKVDKTSSCL